MEFRKSLLENIPIFILSRAGMETGQVWELCGEGDGDYISHPSPII